MEKQSLSSSTKSFCKSKSNRESSRRFAEAQRTWRFPIPSPQIPFAWWQNRFHHHLVFNNSPRSSSPPKSPNRRHPNPSLGSEFRRLKLRFPIPSESPRSRRIRRRKTWRRVRIGLPWPMWCRIASSGGFRTRSRRPMPATRRCRPWWGRCFAPAMEFLRTLRRFVFLLFFLHFEFLCVVSCRSMDLKN